VWVYDELDADGFCLRHIEVSAGDGRTVVAASLVEVVAARDSGGADAVFAYQALYGVVPEGEIPADAEGYSLGPFSADEFERLWEAGRAERERAVQNPR
jgi:hypothetical protein